MPVPMPATIALIVCKVVSGGAPDQNAKWTGYENLQWDTTDSVMHCRRHEVPLYEVGDIGNASAGVPPTVGIGEIDTQLFRLQCQRAGMMNGAQWDSKHRNSKYRFWRVACPIPTIDKGPDGKPGTPDDRIISWTIPPCPTKHGTVECEVDSAI